MCLLNIVSYIRDMSFLHKCNLFWILTTNFRFQTKKLIERIGHAFFIKRMAYVDSSVLSYEGFNRTF